MIYSGRVKPLCRLDLDHVLENTRPIWDAARGKRLFISGGTGFFGAWLLETLLHCNRELELDLHATVLTRDPIAFRSRMPHLADAGALRLLQGDVRDFPFPGEDHELVIHAAAPTTGIGPAQQFELLRTLLDGTSRMLAFAEARGTQKFLFVSSGAVYGRQPEGLSQIPESYEGGPAWLDATAAYAEGKRVCEQMCSLAGLNSSVRVMIARCFAFVGPHLPLDQHFAIGNFIGDALAGKNIAIRGDGGPMRSYLYAADLAIWLWTMLLGEPKPATQPLVLNVGSGEAISIRDLARAVADELNPSLSITIAKQPGGGPIPRYIPDVQRASALLNLRQTIGLRDAIARTAAWRR